MTQLPPSLLRVVEQIRTARASKSPLDIRGGGTKAFYGEVPQGEPLDMRPLAGIASYEPSELVVTVRAGTPLADLEAALAKQGQCLPFEPPRFVPGGTVGGMVAAGLAGPARASAGGVRDYVLGATMINGEGSILTFGGQVMKNVAGYDVSRLLAGSLGVLGVICEVSLKVLPVAPATVTLGFDVDEAEALTQVNAWSRQPVPLSACSWHRDRLHVRLSGAAAAVCAARKRLGGTELDPDAAALWWRQVRDHRHDFFTLNDDALARGEVLWRLAVDATASPIHLRGERFLEWGGALRWWRTAAPAAAVREAAAHAGGHATLFRAGDSRAGVFAPLPEPLKRIHRGLKQAFDPDRVLNPGRLYPDL